MVVTNFTWNKELMAREIKISNDYRSIYLKEDDYVFRNCFGTMGFVAGMHYWEIVDDASSEHELKIGVTA